MTRMSKFILLCLCLVVPQRASAQEGEQTRIEVPLFEGGAGLNFFFHAAREYEKLRPDVKVDLYGDPRIVDKVRVRILESSFPEVSNAGLNWWSMIRNGEVLALDEHLDGPNWEGDQSWRASFLPGSLDRYTHEGKVYGIPFLYSVYVVWYNQVLFEQYGWKKPRTWDEFFVLCEKIKAAGLWPLAFQGRYPGYIGGVIDNAYYHLAGRARFDQQKDLVPGSFDNPEFVRSLKLAQDVARDYFQPGALGMSHTEAQLEFFLGHTAMVFCGSWLKSEMLGKIPDGFRLGSFNLPIIEAGVSDASPDAIYTGSGYFFVFKNSQNPAKGVDFMRFMTSREMAGTFAEMRDVLVAVNGAMEGRLSTDLSELVELAKAATTTYGAAPGEGFPEMDQFLNDVRFKLVSGQLSPEQGAAALESSAETVRNRSQTPDRVTVRHVWKPMLLLGLLALAMGYWLYTTVKQWRVKRAGAAPRPSGVVRLHWGWVVFFVGPAFVFYTAFVIVPSLKSFAWSTVRWDGLTEMSFVGILHFKRLLFESDEFWIALGNNLFIMFVIPAFVLPLALFLAVCISRQVRGAKLFRIAFFFPNILGGVAATLLWMHLYNPQGGPVNTVLVALGLSGFEGFAWLAQNNLYWALVPMSIWGAAGFNMILFLAAMESIPQSLYEAADIDGASVWRQFWQITIPLIWEVLSISIVFMIIGGMKAFEVIWLLTNQAPTTDNHVIGTRMVQAMFGEFKVGESTAIAVLLFLMVFFGTTAALRAMKREAVEF
jgi:ABC-type sugar transport system permease subunit/ABC-type glycerol-3-phosphate transport system substrate-binding protein